jgi:16S rRNA (cytosine1402-N4)-methyltransferase
MEDTPPTAHLAWLPFASRRSVRALICGTFSSIVHAKDASEQHVPVLTAEVLAHLELPTAACVLDCTTGCGGHAAAILADPEFTGIMIGLDVDASNLETARSRLADHGERWTGRRANFAEFDAVLDERGIDHVDAILADLGTSSNQIDDPRRGFSFQADGPLDMRLDDRTSTTAADLVNAMNETELADLIYQYSQERLSRRIARGICRARREQRITTTLRLARVVCSSMGADPTSHRHGIHPATRTFLALRAAVNAEDDVLMQLLAKAPDRLAPGGRIAVISFHSTEDRMVKSDFRRRRADGVYEVVTRKPITASPAERDANPRARSAKMRVARRTDKSAETKRDPIADTKMEPR